MKEEKMKKLIASLAILVFCSVGFTKEPDLYIRKIVIKPFLHRNFQPPNIDNSLQVLIDVSNCAKEEVVGIELVRTKTGQIWRGITEFDRYLLDNPKVHRHYAVFKDRAKLYWPTGEEVIVRVLIDRKGKQDWVNLGLVKIERGD
jgi:hypothetical protein